MAVISKDSFRFLQLLAQNNNKPWFEKNRLRYEQARAEWVAVVGKVVEGILKIEAIPEKEPAKYLHRIYRDIRFSKDKSPYKTHIGIVFPYGGMKEDEWSGMYLGFEPEGKDSMNVYIGGGCYMPSSPYLKRIRKTIGIKYKELERFASDKNFKKEYPKGITGESLKRMPQGYEEGHPASDWLKMKSYTFSTDLSKKDLLSPNLPKILVQKMKAAQPVLRFFAEA